MTENKTPTIVFQTQGIVRKIQSMSDGSMRVIIDTQELGVADVAALYQYVNQFAAMALAANITDEVVSAMEIPDRIEEDGDKSQSQRLRNVIYRLWEQKGKPGSDELYYRATMSKIIEMMKSKLQPKEAPR